MMKKLLIVALILVLCTPIFGARLNKMQLTFLDEWGDPVDMTTSVSLYIYQAGTTTELTSYLDSGAGNTVTQPVTDNSTNTPLDYSVGFMEFWCAAGSYKITVTDGTFTRTVDNITGSDTRFYWPSVLSAIASYSLGQTNDLDFSYAGWILDGDTAGRLDMIPDADGSVVGIGDGSTQSDVYMYSGALTKYWLFDEGAEEVYLAHIDVQYDDDSYAYFGTNNDIAFKFDNANDDFDITGDGSELAIGASGAGLDVYIHGQTGNYVLFDEDNDRAYFEDYDIRVDDGSSITFYHGTGTAVDWTLSMATVETLLWLPAESTDDQTYNIGNATYTSDFRLFGATASTVVFDASADRVILTTYDIEVEDTANLVIGSDDEFAIDNSSETLRFIPSDATDDFAFHFGSADYTGDFIIYSKTAGETFTWDAGADSLTVVGDLALFTVTGVTLPFKIDATGTVSGTAIQFETTSGGIKFQVDGGTNGDVQINVGDDYTNTVTGIWFSDVTEQAKLTSSSTAANSILLTADGGTGSTIEIFNDTGNASTAGAASIQLVSDLGAINLVATANVSVTEGASAVQLTAPAGGIELYSGLDATNAIKLTADGGTSTDIDIYNDTGNTADSIHLLSDLGGVTIDVSGGSAAGDVTVTAGDDVIFTVGGHVRIIDDDLMAFGTGDDVTLNYDEDGLDDLQVKGAVNFETTYCEFRSNPVGSKITGSAGGAVGGTTGDENAMVCDGVNFEYHIVGAGQTITAPFITTDGLNIRLDEVDNEGLEMGEGITARSNSAFIIGTDAFYLKVQLKIETVANLDICAIGFRNIEAYNADLYAYDTYAGLNVNNGTVNCIEELDGGSAAETDSGEAWTDGQIYTLEIKVSALREVTQYISSEGAGNRGTTAVGTPNAFTWTAADVVVPFIHVLGDATAGCEVELLSYECGLQ